MLQPVHGNVIDNSLNWTESLHQNAADVRFRSSPDTNPEGSRAEEGSAAAEAKAGAESQLKARHVGERAARCWGARAGMSPSEATRASITQLLEVSTLTHARPNICWMSHCCAHAALHCCCQRGILQSSFAALWQRTRMPQRSKPICQVVTSST